VFVHRSNMSHIILRIHVARSRHIILAERSAARLALWNLHPVLSHSGRRPGRFPPRNPSHASSTMTCRLRSGRCTKPAVWQHRPGAGHWSLLSSVYGIRHARYACRTWSLTLAASQIDLLAVPGSAVGSAAPTASAAHNSDSTARSTEPLPPAG
jgi:hypothetical protein